MTDRHPVPVGRLAPSPTGLLHLGHARTFLLAWWHIRSRGGRVVLRLEDLDAPRAGPLYHERVLQDLEWLGLDWSEKPMVQSQEAERFAAAIQRVLRDGLAYACVCTRGDLRTVQSAPQQGVTELRYPGTCRGRFASVPEALRVSGRAPGVRFLTSPGSCRIIDGFAGPLDCDVAAEIGDFLIARRDGAPAYQLAVVVDDARQGVTEVLRGDDLLPSAARQWHLQRALGLPHPVWIHVPLVVDGCGRRLAKRSDSMSLAALRNQGVDPRAIVAWAARSAGHIVPNRVTAQEMVAEFRLGQVPHAAVVVGPAEISALQAERVQRPRRAPSTEQDESRVNGTTPSINRPHGPDG
ncbi:tRNA glutamyl-Q(34) synthetase GluQRS [Myxococcota bacterium]